MLVLRVTLACALAGCAAESQRGRPTALEELDAGRANMPDARDAALAPADARQPPGVLEVPPRDAVVPEPTAQLQRWQDAPEGPVPAPRVACERSWPVSQFLGSNENRAALYGGVALDAEGNVLVTGALGGDFDFGDGELDMPWPEEPGLGWPTPPRLPYEATVLLKLDADCNLLWSRALLPIGEDTKRFPRAVGFDAQQNIVLVTESSRYASTGSWHSSSVAFARLAPDGTLIDQRRHELGPRSFDLRFDAARAGQVLISGDLSSYAPVDFGTGPLGDPTRGHNFHALFGPDGTLQSSVILGDPAYPLGIYNHRLGVDGELVAVERNVPNYYGTSLAGPTLIALDRERNVRWRHELHGASEGAESLYTLALANDGKIALYERYASMGDSLTAGFSEWGRDGALVWELPVSELERDGFHVFQLSHGTHTLTALGAITGDVKLGHSALQWDRESHESVMTYHVTQLARGGAPRWVALAKRPEMAMAIAATPREEVFVSGYEWDDIVRGVERVFVRKYASVAAE